VVWVAATALTVLTLGVAATAFVYAEFETKDSAKEWRDELKSQLKTIDSKLDAMGEGRYWPPGQPPTPRAPAGR
jgi:hypothetical protein